MLIKRTTEQKCQELGDSSHSQLLRWMKQLLWDKALSADKSFLCELFLQQLPPHVCMVLASSKDADDLKMLAVLADKVVKVSVPTVSTPDTPSLSVEVEQLWAGIASLKRCRSISFTTCVASSMSSYSSPSWPRTDGHLFIYSGSSLMLGMTRQLMPIIQQCRVFLEGIYTTLCRFTLS